MEYNSKNPAIKRIMREVKDMEKNPSPHYTAKPSEENLFDWHFTVRGPTETDFEGGRFHGRIILPAEYPFKPPNIILLTPNGRFQLHTKICLSITGYHPEFGSPLVATVLTALISFFPAPAEGALGSLDAPSDTRRLLAKKSLNYCCPDCGEKLNDIQFASDNVEEPKLSEADKEFISLVAFKPEAPRSESSTASTSPNLKEQETTPAPSPAPEISSLAPESKPPSNLKPNSSTHIAASPTTSLPSQHPTFTIDMLIVISIFSIIYLLYFK